MKRNQTIPAVLLACVLLAGCTSHGAPQAEAPTSVPVPETIAIVVPETTIPETTAPVIATEATETVAPFAVTVTPVITEPQTSVTVTTADAFLAAIASNTEIIVDAPLIDWSTATGYGTAAGAHYRWEDPFDGPELIISGVSNLTIRGAGADHTVNVLSAVPRYANVLSFENCSNIMVKGLTVGHVEEPGSCIGGVLKFRNCQDLLVEDCGLFGCGTIGVIGESSKNMQIINNDIYECSVAGVEFTNCDDVNVDGCTIRDIGTAEYPGRDFRVYGCGTVTCNGEPVHDFSPRQ